MQQKFINTCYPAKIVSFNPEEQTATVQLAIEQYYRGLFSEEKEFTEAETPEINDVPVHFPSGGGYCLTMPVKPGDFCLVMFAQKGIDHWLYKAAMKAGRLIGRPSSQHIRTHNITDALCMVGFNPIPNAITDFDPDNIALRNAANNTKITLTNAEVFVDAVTKVTVKAPEVLVESPSITLDGDVSITGTLGIVGVVTAQDAVNASGNVTAPDCIGGGISLNGHTHTISGGSSAGTTGGPN